jgi:hypothetical protein
MDWRIKFTNIRQAMLELPTHSGFGSFNMDWRILVFYPSPLARDKIY